MKFIDDTRAQSIGIMRFFLSLIAGAVVAWIVWEITSPLFVEARETGGSTEAMQATDWLEFGVDYLPIVFLFIAFFGLIALSIFQREVRT